MKKWVTENILKKIPFGDPDNPNDIFIKIIDCIIQELWDNFNPLADNPAASTIDPVSWLIGKLCKLINNCEDENLKKCYKSILGRDKLKPYKGMPCLLTLDCETDPLNFYCKGNTYGASIGACEVGEQMDKVVMQYLYL